MSGPMAEVIRVEVQSAGALRLAIKQLRGIASGLKGAPSSDFHGLPAICVGTDSARYSADFLFGLADALVDLALALERRE